MILANILLGTATGSIVLGSEFIPIPQSCKTLRCFALHLLCLTESNHFDVQ